MGKEDRAKRRAGMGVVSAPKLAGECWCRRARRSPILVVHLACVCWQADTAAGCTCTRAAASAAS
jgi:hypothetical protein